ncbi:PREDICTED: small integral membrane protein 5 [Elephantulus edwardii]|uniref:small integral membrane protein 5 n=1 Tax=Elephantulus edwardii TaxID=28737 RepID=UPI0003F091EA|nr:PREDICTED: small integral membrane protein 5 [Elephantulus edwardii]
MAGRSFTQDLHDMGKRLLLKLQRLPKAEMVEVVAISVILLFIATALLLLFIACSSCCVHGCCPQQRGRKTQVRPVTSP